MARALALGWGEPVLCTDSGSGRAQELAALVGGEAVGSNRELAERADMVVLAHKPAQLDAVAREIAGSAKAVVSILARTDAGRAARRLPRDAGLPGRAEHAGRGAPRRARVRRARRAGAGRAPRAGARAVRPPRHRRRRPRGADADRRRDGGVGPAYWALLVEAQVDAAIRRGMPPQLASTLVAETMAGSAELLRSREYDTLALRRAVASPGGTTARGLAALERGGVRAALGAGDGRRGGLHVTVFAAPPAARSPTSSARSSRST